MANKEQVCSYSWRCTNLGPSLFPGHAMSHLTAKFLRCSSLSRNILPFLMCTEGPYFSSRTFFSEADPHCPRLNKQSLLRELLQFIMYLGIEFSACYCQSYWYLGFLQGRLFFFFNILLSVRV